MSDLKGPCIFISGLEESCNLEGIKKTIYDNIKDLKEESVAKFASPWDLDILRLKDPSEHGLTPQIYLQRNTKSGKVRIIVIFPQGSEKEHARMNEITEKYLNNSLQIIADGLRRLKDTIYLAKLEAIQKELQALQARQEELNSSIERLFP